jgi:Domain of Unknown Function (DUF1080)
MFRTSRLTVLLFAFVLSGRGSPATPAEKTGWIDLSKTLDPWKEPHGKWFFAGGVTLKPDNLKLLAAQPGNGVMVNGPTGRTNDLVSKQAFGDLEAHFEFLIPKRSNSGVKFNGQYEIQIYDSFGVKNPTGNDCGGIYPRAEQKPKYHHIDNGVPPLVNAARPAGEWQTLDVIFLAPRFDTAGKKTANARFVKVVLNGQLIHDNVELRWPTGHAWHNPEMATGPLLLQADHGPVAFRNIRVRPLPVK